MFSLKVEKPPPCPLLDPKQLSTPCSRPHPYFLPLLETVRSRSSAGWVLTLLLCPDQCTIAWLWAESPVSAKEVLGSLSSSAANPPARGAFTSSRRPLARGRLPLEPSAKTVVRVSPCSRALRGCARRLLLAPLGLPGANMPCPHRVPANDSPPASPCFFPPLPPPGWSSGSGPGRRPSAAPLLTVTSSSVHWLATARRKRGGSAGDCEAGAERHPGPPVAPQVISAPAKTHVDRSRSPVRARGAPGQPAGRSVRAASIPLRLPWAPATECVAPAEVRVRRGGCARAGERRASTSECVSGEWGGGGREGGGSGWRAFLVLCPLSSWL